MKSCPACGGRLDPWRSAPSSEPGLSGRQFDVLRCEQCGTAVTAGALPGDLHDTGAYSAGAPRLHRLARPILRQFDRRRLALLSTLVPPPARLLDAGAGRGRFVLSAAEAGYQASGIEPSARGTGAAAAVGAVVRRTSIEDAQIEPESIDAVTLWHVLEHLEDPRAALTRIAGWLAPGGVLLVGVPNLASLQAKLGGGRWYHLDLPRHRTHFTPDGVDLLLRRAGLRPVATHHVLLEHNPFGMWQTLVNRLTSHPSYLYNLLKRNAPLRSPDLVITIAAVPLVPVAMLLELLAGIGRRGGTIAVLARLERSPDGYH